MSKNIQQIKDCIDQNTIRNMIFAPGKTLIKQSLLNSRIYTGENNANRLQSLALRIRGVQMLT